MSSMPFKAADIFSDIKKIKIGGNTIYLVNAVDETGGDCVLGLDAQSVVEPLYKSREASLFAYLAIVTTGVQTAELIFRGLKRPLKQRDNTKADADKLIYVWSPGVDYQWQRPSADASFFDEGQISYREPLKGEVFFVIVTPNKGKYRDRYPKIYGWIEHWSWLPEDKEYAGHPAGWQDRYDEKVWSAGQATKSEPARASSRRKK